MASSATSFSLAGCFHGAFAGSQLARYGGAGLGSVGGAPLRLGTSSKLALAVAPGFMASMGSRLAVVVAAAPSAPGENDDDDRLPSHDCEAAVSTFCVKIEVFKLSQRPLAFVSNPTDPLLEAACGTAKDNMVMVEFLLSKEPVHRDILKAFLVVEVQAKQGYVKADAIVDAIQGLKLVGKTFFEGANFPEYSAPMVPLSADDVDKDSFFKELINLFIVFYTAIYWEAGTGSTSARAELTEATGELDQKSR